MLWEEFNHLREPLIMALLIHPTPSARVRSLMSEDPERSHEPLATNQKQQTDLEVKDDGPDQTQGQLRVAVCDVIISDVHQLDLKQRNHWDLGAWFVCLTALNSERYRETETERMNEYFIPQSKFHLKDNTNTRSR